MGVVAHHGPCVQPDSEAVGEHQQSLFDPATPMVEAAPGDGVFAAEPGAAHAPAHAVVETGLLGIDDEGAWVTHRASFDRSDRPGCG